MKGNIKQISLDAFARELGRNQDIEHVVLLGAGASWSSGIPTARDCIWQWKLELYQSNSQGQTVGLDLSLAAVQQKIQDWIDQQGGYPWVFQTKPATDSIAKLPPIPFESCHLFR